jgi:hypothetical protein
VEGKGTGKPQLPMRREIGTRGLKINCDRETYFSVLEFGRGSIENVAWLDSIINDPQRTIKHPHEMTSVNSVQLTS